jgi:hypothetical protein
MIAALLIAWAALLAALIGLAIGRSREGGALTLAYFLGLSLIHTPGVLPFLTTISFSTFSQGLSDPIATEVGFKVTVFGMGAFVAGAILARIIDWRRIESDGITSYRRSQAFERIGWRGLAIGAFGYFVLLPLSHNVASLTATISPIAILLILGFWLMLYGAAESGDRRRTRIVLALLPGLPLATLVTGGFLGYGIYWVLSILAFLFVISRHRARFYAATPFVVYLGLSLFVAYMGQRTGIRELVWEKQAGLPQRLERVAGIFTSLHPLDLTSPVDLGTLDSRLNQNVLVGLAVQHIDSGWAQFAYGATVPIWGLVPRAIWPEKPDIGGGRTVVAEFTGIHFWEDTSVGTGQVFEFYVNFGIAGVLAGFLLLGFALMWLDRGIMRALDRGDMRGLLLRALPGLALLQPGGNLLEIIVAVVAAIVLSHLLIHFRGLRIAWPVPGVIQTAPPASDTSSRRYVA